MQALQDLSSVDPDDLLEVLNNYECRRHPKKVSRLLKFPADMTAKHKEVEHHLRWYIRELDEAKLGKFLRFCTGSDLIVSRSIIIEFTSIV